MRASELASALEPLLKVIEDRASIEILTHVRLTAGKKRLRLTGTDLDTEAVVSLPYSGAALDTTAPARLLMKALQALGDAEITIKPAGRRVEVAGSMTFTFKVPDIDGFPKLKVPDGDMVEFNLSEAVLSQALATVAPAISREETRHYLKGVYLQVIDGEMAFTATDGHRLHMARYPAPPEALALAGRGVIIPRRAIHLLRSLLRDGGAEQVAVKVWPSALRARFALRDHDVLMKTIDGTYPDYARIVPKDAKGTFAVPAAAFLSAVAGIDAVTNDKYKIARLDCDASVLSSSGAETSASAPLDADRDGSLPSEIGFNAHYLREMVGVRPEGRALFRLTDAEAPALIEFEDDPSFRAVLMPMRLS